MNEAGKLYVELVFCAFKSQNRNAKKLGFENLWMLNCGRK
jgi:hypothetical protein